MLILLSGPTNNCKNTRNKVTEKDLRKAIKVFFIFLSCTSLSVAVNFQRKNKTNLAAGQSESATKSIQLNSLVPAEDKKVLSCVFPNAILLVLILQPRNNVSGSNLPAKLFNKRRYSAKSTQVTPSSKCLIYYQNQMRGGPQT